MIKILKRNEDVFDYIEGDTSSIVSIKYYTTDKTAAIEPHTEQKGEGDYSILVCRLCSQELQTLEAGQLHCMIETAIADDGFCDGAYNKVYDEDMPIWLK